MSPLLEKLKVDLLEAQKKRDGLLVSTLRYLLSFVKNREIELRPLNKELTDDEVVSVIAKQIKQRRESIEEFQKGGRQNLVDKEKSELAILETYLPKQLSDEEIVLVVDEAVSQSGAKSVSDMGKVMGLITPKLKGRADMAKVSNLVKSKLVS
ncbi:MAG: GatB/YqeY domain-containing protein [Patescibacteria group bacterium]